ncbi:MAG: hypothetical protein M5U01_09925 [Ardenticatenaceae bacterium]|nr:hypothetical protein [Ardenticatenaceae bacterium]
MGRIVAARQVAVALQSRLSGVKHGLTHERGDRNGDPLLRRRGAVTLTTASRSQGRLPSLRWYLADLVPVGGASIRRVAEDIVNGGRVPAVRPLRRRDVVIAQPLGDLVQGARLRRIGIPGKALGHHGCFDRVKAHAARIARSLRIEDVPVRGDAPRQELAAAQFRLPATAHALGNQAALIFGHRPTDLQQQLIVRVIRHRPLQKLDRAPHLIEFINNEHLMDRVARQAIWRHDHEAGKRAARRLIAQAVQTGTIEPRPTDAIIAVDVLLGKMPVRMIGDRGAKPLELLLDGLSLSLPVGRHTRIQSDFHEGPPEWMKRLESVPFQAQSSTAEGTGRHYPIVTAHKGTFHGPLEWHTPS